MRTPATKCKLHGWSIDKLLFFFRHLLCLSLPFCYHLSNFLRKHVNTIYSFMTCHTWPTTDSHPASWYVSSYNLCCNKYYITGHSVSPPHHQQLCGCKTPLHCLTVISNSWTAFAHSFIQSSSAFPSPHTLDAAPQTITV